MLKAVNTLLGDGLNFASAIAYDYPLQTYHKSIAAGATPPAGTVAIDGFLYWSGTSRPVVGVSIDINQNGNIEIWTPNTSSLQSGRITGQTANNETQRVNQLRSYINSRLGSPVDIWDEVLTPAEIAAGPAA